MATIQRPLKEGSVRTYQEKVGLGFLDILASEMDADLDGIYGAWNGGADTINIKDGAVTYAKLATDAKLWTDTGSALAPTINTRNLQLGSGTMKALLDMSFGGDGGFTINSPYTPQDATKSSWYFQLSPSNDGAQLIRRAPNAPAGTVTVPFLVRGSDGKTVCTLADASVGKAMLGVLSTPRAYVGATVPQNWTIPSKTAWVTFTSATLTTSGGLMLALVEPFWMWLCSSLAGIGVQILDNGASVYSRMYVPNSAAVLTTLPGFAAFFAATAGAHTFTVQVYADANGSISTPNISYPGNIWFIELN